MGYGIRRLQAADAEAAVALRREMIIDRPVSFLGTLEEDAGLDADIVRERLAHPINCALGAFDDSGALVATATLIQQMQPKLRHKGLVVSVYTTPRCRRQGLSRRLILQLLEYGRSVEGMEIVGLGVSAEAPEAQALYETLGFVAWGREPRAIRTDGRDVDEIHMWREL